MGALQAHHRHPIDAADATCLSPGPAIMLCRHASLADSLLSAWVVTSKARDEPALRAEEGTARSTRASTSSATGCRTTSSIASRPTRRPNWPRSRALSAGLDRRQIAVIFPEGTRAVADEAGAGAGEDPRARPDAGRSTGSAAAPAAAAPRGSAALLDGLPGGRRRHRLARRLRRARHVRRHPAPPRPPAAHRCSSTPAASPAPTCPTGDAFTAGSTTSGCSPTTRARAAPP